MQEGMADVRGARFETAPFAGLRKHLEGVDLTQAVYLDRGTQVTAYRAGAWVIRVPGTAAARRKIARQTHVCQVLAGRGLAVPRDAQIAYDADGEVAAACHRYIAGDPAREGGRNADLARDLGEFLTALHAVPLEPVRGSCEMIDDLWSDRFHGRWKRARTHLPAAARGWLEGVITRFLASQERSSTRKVLIHGDLVEDHILVSPDGRLAGVIDLSGPWIADPALDFGTLAERFGWAFADAVLASYAGPRDPGFQRRACFCANVRPLVTIEAGLRHQSDERLRLGLQRLAERMAEGRESG